MTFVVLLRGINVGGNNIVEMKKLKATFEVLGHLDVVTYINSGNILFTTNEQNIEKLEHDIEARIEKDFGPSIRVVLRTKESIAKLVSAIHPDWQNGQDVKTDVLFLWEEVNNESVLESLTAKPVDHVLYTHGGVVWHIERKDVGKSGLLKIVGTPLYNLMTIRNINTVRKLSTLMN